MRKIVNATYMTLDGDITNMQDRHFDYVGEEAMAAATAQLFGSDALIMGSKTYEGFAPAWTERAGADEFADRMNAIRKYVVSATLRDPTWTNTSVISGEGVAEVRSSRISRAPRSCNTASTRSPGCYWTTACSTSSGSGCTRS